MQQVSLRTLSSCFILLYFSLLHVTRGCGAEQHGWKTRGPVALWPRWSQGQQRGKALASIHPVLPSLLCSVLPTPGLTAELCTMMAPSSLEKEAGCFSSNVPPWWNLAFKCVTKNAIIANNFFFFFLLFFSPSPNTHLCFVLFCFVCPTSVLILLTSAYPEDWPGLNYRQNYLLSNATKEVQGNSYNQTSLHESLCYT